MQQALGRRSAVAAAVAGVVLGCSAGQSFAAGFALQENSGSGMGNAFSIGGGNSRGFRSGPTAT